MKDPCWDFEGTEGFEAHRGELAAFHDEWRERWAAGKLAQLEAKAIEIGCPGNIGLAGKFMELEITVATLASRMDRLEDNVFDRLAH